MAYRIDPTPNPNSLKITVDRALNQGKPATYALRGQGPPVARDLLSIPGIASVFLLGYFCTVTKEPEQEWGALEPAIEDVLRRHFGSN